MHRAHAMVAVVIALTVCTVLFSRLSSRGTLIVEVPTKEGMLVVSDKLLTISSIGHADTHVDGAEKVRRLSATAAVGFTGLISFSNDSSSNRTLLEDSFAVNFAESYFVTNRVDDFDGKLFAQNMSEQVSNYLAHLNRQYDVSMGPGCVFLVFRATPARERRTFAVFLALGQSGTNMTVTSTTQQEIVQRDNDAAHILAFGQPDVPEELAHGKDPRFDDLRSNWMIAKFLPQPPKIRDAELDDAQLFGRYLIEQASVTTILLNPRPGIGSTVDETILSF